MDEPPDGDSVSNFSHVSSSSSDDSLVLIRVFVPDLKVQKCLQFHRDDLVWDIKQQVLAALPKELRDCQNYGLFSPPSNGKAGKFLDEERPIADYPFSGPIGYFELKYKRRIYKMQKLDAKQLKQLHTRSNFKKMIDYLNSGNEEKVSKMLNKGFDPNFQCVETGETLLSLTAGLKHPAKMVMLLVNGGAILDYRTRDGKTALHRAVERNNYEALKTILDLGASPHYKDNKGLTPLYYTVTQNADPQICELLLHDHSMIGVSDLQGWQEVHQAARNGLVQHLEHLLFYGADMNGRNASGNTPLHVCAVNDQESCARVLLFRGCDKEAMNFANQTPYQVAVIANNLHLADIIQRHGPDHIVPFREVPRYNPRRRASLAASVVSAALNRTHSDPRLELVLQTGTVLRPPSPSPSNRSLPPFSSASSSGETTCTETSSSGSTATTCTSSQCGEDSEGTTSSSIMTDSSGVGTSMNSGGSYESSPYPEAIVMNGMTVVCVENHVDYNSPGHLKVYQGDILEVTGVTDCGLIEAKSRQGEHGFVPTSCVQEVKLRQPDSRSHSMKTRTEGRRELDTKSLSTTPRGFKAYGEPRTVVLHKGKKGFGFVLRGAKAASPLLEAPPCEDLPSLQYLEDVDNGGVADRAGLRKGDYLLEINGIDVALVSHENVVDVIRKSGDLVAMTVISPQIPLTNLATVDINARQCATLPRKLSGKRAPVPPKRNPTTALSVGRERAKSLVAGLAEIEALDRVMGDYDSEGRSTKSSSAESLPNKQAPKNQQEQPKIASIRTRLGSHRTNPSKLEEMFNRYDPDQEHNGANNSYPTSPLKSPKVYTSVAEMKRSKAKANKSGTLVKLHNSFRSTPELREAEMPVEPSTYMQVARHRSHSQSDVTTLNLQNLRQTWMSAFGKNGDTSTNRNSRIITKPPPDEPPPPPPIGQIVKVDVSKVHGDYASVNVSALKKDEVMSSFRPGDSAKLYASPETVVTVGFKDEQANNEEKYGRSRKVVPNSNTPSRSNSLPPKIAPVPQIPPNHQSNYPPNSNLSSESENSGDSSSTIYSTFKNIRNRTNVNKPVSVDSVSTDSGNSTDKSNATKEKPLYAKPVLKSNRSIVPQSDYETREPEQSKVTDRAQHLVQISTWDSRSKTVDSTQSKMATVHEPQEEKIASKIIKKDNKSVIVISTSNSSTPTSTIDRIQRRGSCVELPKPEEEGNASFEFRDDLAKKIAERKSKIVVVNSDDKNSSTKGHKVEIVDVKPGTMKDIIEIRKEMELANSIDTASRGSVKKNISVFERKQEVKTTKVKFSEHRRSDGIRLNSDNDSSLMKSSQSFPLDLMQEDSSGISSDADCPVENIVTTHPDKADVRIEAGEKTAQEVRSGVDRSKSAYERVVIQHAANNSSKANLRIQMGTGQALLRNSAIMDSPSAKKVSMIQSASLMGRNSLPRTSPGAQNIRHFTPKPTTVQLSGTGVRPKHITAATVKETEDKCMDLEKSIEASLEMIKKQVDMISSHGQAPGLQKGPEFVPPPPEFDFSMIKSMDSSHNVQLPAAIAPPPEFSDSFKSRNEQHLAHSLPKTKYSRETDYLGTRSQNSSPARQFQNGTIPPTSSLKFDTPTSSLLPSVNGPKIRSVQKEFRNKSLQQWSGKDVSDWLESLFMPEYKSNFSDAGITGSRLANIGSEELAELGVKRVGHRLNIERSLKRKPEDT